MLSRLRRGAETKRPRRLSGGAFGKTVISFVNYARKQLDHPAGSRFVLIVRFFMERIMRRGKYLSGASLGRGSSGKRIKRTVPPKKRNLEEIIKIRFGEHVQDSKKNDLSFSFLFCGHSPRVSFVQRAFRNSLD